MDDELREKILRLRELVWEQDVPSPTTPAYVQLHQGITRILKFIDSELLALE